MKRYLSLDVLRGLTVAFMILVNNPGTWKYVYPPLRHAAWTGCTPTDLVFPFFLFCTGAAMAFSFAKFDGINRQASWKIIRRGILIFLTGFLLNAFPFFPVGGDPEMTLGQNYGVWLGNLRIFNVLQRIAVSYVIAAFIALWLRKPRKIIWAIVLLSVLYTGLMYVNGSENAFSAEGNVPRLVDLAVLGESHLYHGYSDSNGNAIAFDPEGILGCLSGACSVLVGYLVGLLVRKSRPDDGNVRITDTITLIYTAAVLCIVGGLFIGLWIPVSKPLWTTSYMLYASGWAMAMLALLMYVIDYKGVEKPFTVFKACGMNPLFIYALSGILGKTINLICPGVRAAFNHNEFTSLLYALLFVAVHILVAVILYRKKIFIKI